MLRTSIAILLVVHMLVFSSGLFIFRHVCHSSGEVVVSLMESNATCNRSGQSGNCHLPASTDHFSCCQSNSHCHIDKASCCRTYFEYYKVKTEFESGKRLLVIKNQPVVLHTVDLVQELPTIKFDTKKSEISQKKIPDHGRKIILQIHQIKIPLPPAS